MNAAQIKAIYRKMCVMDLTIRRYVDGSPTDYPVKGHFRLFGGKELVGTIVQGDMAIIVLHDDLVEANFPLPIVTADRVLAGAVRERRIVTPPGERKALDGEVVAYDVQARG